MTEKGRFIIMLIITIISCAATVFSAILAYIAFEQKNAAESERDKATEIAMVERNRRLEAESALQKELKNERDRLNRFEREYRAHLASLKKAKIEYEKYDTEAERREIGEEEAKRRQEEAFKDLKSSVRAFIDFVGKWREVQTSLKSLINSVVNQLERDTQENNRKEVINGIDVILKKSESDITVLEEALEKTLEDKSKGK